ncbi:uncharacterized protein [Aegilops tauschii subsp. strangulata]|uniref:Uncharacterized protein n=1 Tax=Aegilops tauschii TaxID=37682 RepID=N1QXF3_AEGTA|nr:uncharacterized protein LOC109734007 [Aegilops tauschii subsp. strangulata]
MAGGGTGLAVRVWKEWGIQILVVASFLLQLVLMVGGELRRRSSSAVLLAFLWMSYLMADNIAVYALGHMSIESRLRDGELVAFWATFFLLHLGGQDTITALSLEDNQLWRRHLLTLLVQASGAGYAIYRYTLSGTWTLVSATIVMFIVGFAKYGERVWALQRGNNEAFDWERNHDNTQERANMLKTRAKMDTEEVIQLYSHYMFYFCKGAFFNVNREIRFSTTLSQYFRNVSLPYKCDIGMYDLVEAELSLLYDQFYTKAQVVHTWQGCLIRAISLIGTASTLLLFLLDDGKGAYSTVDVSITYLLLVGAIILETMSVFTLARSRWTCEYLRHLGWNRAVAMVMCLRRLFRVGRQRKWLHSIGQHNVFDYCARHQTMKCRNMIVEAAVPKKWWRKVNFSGNTKITVEFKELVLARILRTMTDYSETWSIWDAQGRAVLTEYGILDDFRLYIEGGDFARYILNWHVATDIYFYFCNDQQQQSRSVNTEEDDKPLVEAIKVLSNYMAFLMIHVSLLPGGVPHNYSVDDYLDTMWVQKKGHTSKAIARLLVEDKIDDPRSGRCASLARELLGNKRDVPMLQVIFGVWVEFLCHAAHHSTDTSHLTQLGRGGEFLTAIRLVIDHIELFQRYKDNKNWRLRTAIGDVIYNLRAGNAALFL